MPSSSSLKRGQEQMQAPSLDCTLFEEQGQEGWPVP